MRCLGIDYGQRVVGLALSDEGGSLAFPASILPRNGSLFGELKELVEREHISVAVLGKPLTEDGQENDLFRSAEKFKEKFEKETGLEVVWQDERFTTQEALKSPSKNKRSDASAAALILQRYLDAHNESQP